MVTERIGGLLFAKEISTHTDTMWDDMATGKWIVG